MGTRRYEFGTAERIDAEAIGVPGQRRFRLLVESTVGVACLWLEKEQLQALGMAIDQVVAGMPALWSRGSAQQAPPESMTAFGDPSVEFTVGRLGLGFDEEAKLFLVQAYDIEDDPEGEATFQCHVSREQLRALGGRIGVIVAAGRPRCPLCGAAIEGAHHSCAGQNGHVHH